MGFLDAFLGRTHLPKPNEDRLFAMSTAVVALEASGLKPSGRMGVVFKRLPPGRFDQLEAEIKQMLALQDTPTQPTVEMRRDDLGFDWIVLSGHDFQEALATLHMVGTRLQKEGLGDLLLASVFRFEQADQTVYWVYSYKRGSFYPFLPITSGERRRDNAEELRLAALAKLELPVEAESERWFPLWGLPL